MHGRVYRRGRCPERPAADYALKYWITKLRAPGWKDNVPANLSGVPGSDPASWQHVNFAALALGTEGTLPVGSQTTTSIETRGRNAQVAQSRRSAGVRRRGLRRQHQAAQPDGRGRPVACGGQRPRPVRQRGKRPGTAQRLRGDPRRHPAGRRRADGRGQPQSEPDRDQQVDLPGEVRVRLGRVGAEDEDRSGNRLALPSPPNPIWERPRAAELVHGGRGTAVVHGAQHRDDGRQPLPFKNAVAFRAPVTPPPPNTHITTAPVQHAGRRRPDAHGGARIHPRQYDERRHRHQLVPCPPRAARRHRQLAGVGGRSAHGALSGHLGSGLHGVLRPAPRRHGRRASTSAPTTA